MARKQARDSRGRFTSGGSGSAPKRVRFKLAYHGTSAEGAKGIKRSGYRESTGTGGSAAHAGKGVYLTSSTSTALMYPKSMRGGDRTQQRFVRHRMGPKAIAKAKKVVDTGFSSYGARERTYLMPASTANRTIINTPTIRAQGPYAKRAKANRKQRRKKS